MCGEVARGELSAKTVVCEFEDSRRHRLSSELAMQASVFSVRCVKGDAELLENIIAALAS
jgi:hypothetical protein